MHPPLSIALAQLNPHLGNVRGNLDRLVNARAKAAENGAVMIVTPEMYLAGYPCDDLVLRSDFMDEMAAAIEELTALTEDGGPAIIVGAPHAEGGVIHNSVFVLDGGTLLGRRDKVNLPNYGVFDDKRNFVAGAMPGPIMVRGLRLGLPVCEDIWTPDVIECLAESGAQMIIALNASPFETGKTDQRMLHAVARAVEAKLPIVYVNMIGGQDELVYDGGSFAINRGGKLACHLPSFSESVTLVEVTDQLGCLHVTGQITPPDEGVEALYRGLMLGLRDYVEKNGFPGVALGLSGGIDSALVAAIAADAVGPEKVHAVMMPSPYTSQESLDDAADLAARYGIPLDTINIGPAMEALDTMLASQFAGTEAGIAEENIQSRLRGLVLMALSNKHGPMVLATGNKSEYAAGYSTLYGDMCGGFAPLKDVWKVQVFDLAAGATRTCRVAPLALRERLYHHGSSKSLPRQSCVRIKRTRISLPPYERLDVIMMAICEEMSDIETIIARGYDREEVARASQLLFRAEYKRFQAAPGPKMTPLAFGRDRRLPLTSGFNPLHSSGSKESS